MTVRHQTRRRWPGRGAVGPLSGLLLALAVSPLAHAADTTYKIQRIVQVGDLVGDQTVSGPLAVGGLSDNGQLVVSRLSPGPGPMVLSSADGKLTPLVVGGQQAPDGQWPSTVSGNSNLVVSNQNGSVVFEAQEKIGDKQRWGCFLWNALQQKFTTVALGGTPATSDLTFKNDTFGQPNQNNHEEAVFAAFVTDATGATRRAVFFRDRAGKLLPVARPDEPLPDGRRMVRANGGASVNDAGVIAFGAQRDGDPNLIFSAYRWENGTITPIALVGTEAPGGDRIAAVSCFWLNDLNRSVVLALRLAKTPSQAGVYQFTEGKLVPVAEPGREMPGGGKLKTIPEVSGLSGSFSNRSISHTNALGQTAFIARLDDNRLAAYLLGADGTLSRILLSGASTEVGTVTLLTGSGIGLNGKGQVALAGRIENGPGAIVLLTPTTP